MEGGRNLVLFFNYFIEVNIMSTLELQQLAKVYDNGVCAVTDFNLTVADGEFIVFVGPSGCGKSTTLRMIAGLEQISEGSFLIDGKRMNEVAPKNRNIAMVFQHYALYPHMTVFDNMAFGLKMRHVSKKRNHATCGRSSGDVTYHAFIKTKTTSLIRRAATTRSTRKSNCA